ncbi:peptidase M15B and M15C DD-carboxypeptidase VanY/endolysin [Xylanimonas cellulosilytica DSM 15894]|uniref:Peptidase M15B and M15C DD-carboxypeptidase VanY/endolysin n=1 Tax=Xylanimonas cellulosilytica (strain DSM 15894 / JCM 12276 / CECT 5975 / KCTC 9989 / LMG 20990 / NBRC 107835 / XIL07) TaxID=446471 RepID=D1BSQ2_XYLCX|nr:M15 family metallopeptidase [Xylanimonas cellulosilytica]ACZ30744.1 peptidase M15B and M15C DD-carboxypeptidase VanY/endolysin [Xylanimonas cellulosilytica DSM 15894]
MPRFLAPCARLGATAVLALALGSGLIVAPASADPMPATPVLATPVLANPVLASMTTPEPPTPTAAVPGSTPQAVPPLRAVPGPTSGFLRLTDVISRGIPARLDPDDEPDTEPGGEPGGAHPAADPALAEAWLAQAGDPGSLLVVITKRRALPADHVPGDLDGASGVLLRRDASDAFVRLAAAAEAAGVPVRARSGYRSYLDQQVTFERWQRELGGEAAEGLSARPGHSEHQTGLAVDVVARDGECRTLGCFAETAQADWLAANAAGFGFLVRYQPGQESVTGYAAEAWHLRYVGEEAAHDVVASGAKSIEEYLGLAPAPTS